MRDRIMKIIAEQFNMDQKELTDDTSFTDDLNIDSIELLELIMSIEEEFDIEVKDEDLEKIRTIGNIIDYLEE